MRLWVFRPADLKTALRACETLWGARKIASVALSTEREGDTENVFHIILKMFSAKVDV